MTEKKWPVMATIAGTHARSEAEGLGLSKNLIRNLILSGTVKSVKVGKNTRLINWYCLMDFLYGKTAANETEIPEKNVIRKIEAR